jgi:hypothetical protein
MGTRSTLSTMVDGQAIGVYVHWDGYPEARIPLLLNHYNSQEDAEALVALGSISSLRERIAPNEDEVHTFDESIKDVTIAHHRDRGDELEQYKGKTKDDVCDEEWYYHFEDGEWLYCEGGDNEWLKCTDFKEE